LAISFVLLQNIVPASKLADDIKISNLISLLLYTF
jgi:hypothetical protein